MAHPTSRSIKTPRFQRTTVLAPPPPTGFGVLATVEARMPYRPRVMMLLTLIYSLVATVPTHPWSGIVDGDLSTGGDSRSAMIMVSMLALALIPIIERRHLALALFIRTWPLALVLGWCLASMAWADFPVLTFKRTAFLIIGYLVSVGLAVGLSSPRQILRPMLLAFGVVLLADLVSVFLIPALAVEDIGAKGMHTSKNIAGCMAMLGLWAMTFVFLSETSQKWKTLTIVAALTAVTFLVLTRSKTSMGVLGVFFVFFLPLALVIPLNRLTAALMILLAAFFVTGFLFISGLMGWGWGEILTLVVGDPTFTSRTDLWAFIWDRIADMPILGSGYGSFWGVPAAYDPLRDAPNWLRDTALGQINEAHNGYLDLWVQSGIVGLALGAFALTRALALAATSTANAPPGGGRWAPHAMIFTGLAMIALYNTMETAWLSRVHFANQIVVLLAVLADRWRLPSVADGGTWISPAAWTRRPPPPPAPRP